MKIIGWSGEMSGANQNQKLTCNGKRKFVRKKVEPFGRLLKL